MTLLLINKSQRNERLVSALGADYIDQLSAFVRYSWGEYDQNKLIHLVGDYDKMILVMDDQANIQAITGYTWYQLAYQDKSIRAAKVGLTVINEQAKGRGYMSKLIAMMLMVAFIDNQFKNFLIGMRTADPRIYKYVKYNAGMIYPDHEMNAVPDEYVAYAEQISKMIDGNCEFIRDHLVSKGSYQANPDLAASKRHALNRGNHDPEILDFFERHLDLDRGDAFIILTQFNLSLLLTCICKYSYLYVKHTFNRRRV